MQRKFFSTKKARVIALVLAAVLAVSGLSVGLAGTFAIKQDITVNLKQPNEYDAIEKNATDTVPGSGLYRASSSDPNYATAELTPDKSALVVTGKKAGVVYAAVSSLGGYVRAIPYQITDSANITSYTLKRGGEIFLKTVGNTAAATGSGAYITTTPGVAVGSIRWRSLQTEIATVDETTGLITSVGKGSAIIIGTFTDKWGMERDLHILVQSGVSNGRLGELIELIIKGETIIEYDGDIYTTDSLNDLQNAVNNGNGVLNMDNPSDAVIDDAIDRLIDALNNLERKPTRPGDVLGPDSNGNYYRPVGDPENVYEIVNEDGSSKYQPPQYIYNPDGDPIGSEDKNVPAEKDGGFYYVEDPENIWHKVNGDGTLSDDDVIWGGPNGKPGGGDDLPVKKFGNDWWVNRGQNVWQKVNPNGNNAKQLGPLTGGGPDDNPATGPVTPIFPANNNGLPFTDGKYYIGPLDPGPNEYYIGDKPVGQGGDGKLNSTTDVLDGTDCIYWLVDGQMTTTPPTGDGDPTPADDDRVLSTEQTGDTSEWIEIARSGGYSLIIRRNYVNVYTGTGHIGEPHWQYTAFGTTDTYKSPTSSTLRNAINNWFKGTASGTANKLASNARLRSYTMSNNASDLPGTANEVASLTNGFSKPTVYQDGMNDDIAFALSASEAIKFCSKRYRVNGSKAGDSAAPAPAKFNKLIIPANGTYGSDYYTFGIWLRSAGTLRDGLKTGGILNGSDGDVFQFHLKHGTPSGNTEAGLVYPALWVKSTIFTDPVINIPANGGSYTDNKGVTWIVLTTDANGNKLLMTDYVYLEAPNGPKYVNSGNYVAYESSNLKTAMEDWFNANAGGDIKGIARGYSTPLPTGNSQAGGTIGTGKPFPLSQDEFNSYVPAGKKKGVGYPSGYSGRDWYLRTGSGSSVNMVNSAGTVASCNVGVNTTGIRPAVWVKP